MRLEQTKTELGLTGSWTLVDSGGCRRMGAEEKKWVTDEDGRG